MLLMRIDIDIEFNASSAVPVPAVAPEDDPMEDDILGLDVQPQKKRKVSQGSRPKGREEMLHDELEKCRASFMEITEASKESLPPLPPLTKLEKASTKKSCEARDRGFYGASQSYEALTAQILSFKEAVRVSNLYLAKEAASPAKHEDSFLQCMGKLDATLRAKLPQKVQGHYLQLRHFKDTSSQHQKCGQWFTVFLFMSIVVFRFFL